MKRLIYLIIIGATALIGIIELSNYINADAVNYNLPARPEHVDDRQWYRLKQRGGTIDPQKIVDGRARLEKLQSIKKKNRDNYKDGGIRFWNDLGPGNIGGRVRAIAIKKDDALPHDPIIVGAAGGGIWRSLDGGASWVAANDFLPSLAVTSFGMAQPIASTIYAATGEGQAASTIGLPGAGIFKSTDSGASWTQLPSTANSEFYWVNKVAVNPINSDHVLAVTSQVNSNGALSGGKLKESLNGGISWSDKLDVPGFLTDVEFHPMAPSIRVVSGHGEFYVYNSNFDIYESKNADIGNYGGRIEVALAPSDPSYIYVQLNSLVPTSLQQRYRSTNGGVDWSYIGGEPDVFSSVTLGNYASNVWVDPLDETQVYYGGLDLWRSTDSGVNISRISDWTQYHVNGTQLHADQHIIIPNTRYSLSNRTVYMGNDGGIQRADNITTASVGGIGPAGYTNLVGTTLNITQFYSASASPHSDLVGGGTQDNSFLTGTDNDDWFQHNTGDGSMVLFHPTDPDIIYANTNHNNLRKSTDGGANYTSVAELGDTEAELIAPIAINPANPDHIYLGGKSLWRYDDSDGSLTSIKDPFIGGDIYISAIEVSEDGNQIWVGYDVGQVAVTTNNGANWTVATAEPNIITDIAINNKMPAGTLRDVLISSGGYRQDNISRHTFISGGFPITEDISLDFDMQVNTVTFHPNNKNWIYAGTDVGIFSSENGGNTWSITPINDGPGQEYDNDGPVYTEVSELFWDSIIPFKVWSLHAATFGRGIWFSNAILDTIHVDLTYTGFFKLGTRDLPFPTFDQGLAAAENTGAVLNVIGQGDYNEISPARVLDKRVLMKNSGGGNSIVE